MKKKSLTLAILTSMMIMAFSGCNFLSDLTSSASNSDSSAASTASESSEPSVDSGVSVESQASQESYTDSSEAYTQESTEETSVPSDTVSTVEGSENTTDSSADSDSNADSSEDSATADESSYEYSEQTLDINYKNPSVFTDNEEFNQLFANNSIDKAYTEAARQTDGTTSTMRSLAQEYGEKWEAEVDTAYEILCDELSDNPEQLTQLKQSQQDWLGGVDAVKQEFYNEQKTQGGSIDLLTADTQILNYNKARAASLYEEIFQLTGNFRMK